MDYLFYLYFAFGLFLVISLPRLNKIAKSSLKELLATSRVNKKNKNETPFLNYIAFC